MLYIHLTTVASFIIFDVDGDGYISSDDMRKVLNLLVGTNMSPAAVSEVIRRTMETADIDRDGRISFEDFSAVRQQTIWARC